MKLIPLEVYGQLNGNVVIGDESEDAPMVELHFHNQYARLTPEQKHTCAGAVVLILEQLGVGYFAVRGKPS